MNAWANGPKPALLSRKKEDAGAFEIFLDLANH
jgi:hypothetical protein